MAIMQGRPKLGCVMCRAAKLGRDRKRNAQECRSSVTCWGSAARPAAHPRAHLQQIPCLQSLCCLQVQPRHTCLKHHLHCCLACAAPTDVPLITTGQHSVNIRSLGIAADGSVHKVCHHHHYTAMSGTASHCAALAAHKGKSNEGVCRGAMGKYKGGVPGHYSRLDTCTRQGVVCRVRPLIPSCASGAAGTIEVVAYQCS
jgi:hypothetical protein